MEIDSNAHKHLQQILSVKASIIVIQNILAEELSQFFVMWKEGGGYHKVRDYSHGGLISGHEWQQKEEKILYTKNAVLASPYFDTTLMLARRDESSSVLIIDGIHRAIGISMALYENPTKKVNIRGILLESQNLADVQEDYAYILKQSENEV